jgi:MinD-like ATPase involved in chromosome partitioning or flagellar assembly
LRLSIEGVSLNGTTSSPFLRFGTNSARQITAALASSSNQWRGQVVIDLATGMYVATTAQESSTDSAVAVSYAGYSGITTASTSLTISASNQNFDLGSIKVYGEK